MTTSYLDETWFETQAGELSALRARLQEHLDVIALATAQLPDLAGQLQRLEQRELETFKKLDTTRQSTQKELRTALGTAVAEVAGTADELGRRLEGQTQASETVLTAAAAQLQTSLQEQHGQVRQQLQDEFEVMLEALPETAQRMEHRMAELQKMLEGRLDDFQTESGQQGLQLLEKGEASLQAESVRLQKLVTLQGERSLEASVTLDRERQNLEQSLLDLLDETAQRFERRLAESEERAAAGGAQAETQITTLESRLERLQNQNGQLEAEIAVARQESAQLRAEHETMGECLDTLSQLTEQVRLGADTRLQKIEAQWLGWAQELSQVRAVQQEQTEQAQADLQDMREQWDARLAAHTDETARQMETLTQAADVFRLDVGSRVQTIETELPVQERRWGQDLARLWTAQQEHAEQARNDLKAVHDQWAAHLTARTDETTQQSKRDLDQQMRRLDAHLGDLGAQVATYRMTTEREIAHLNKTMETMTSGLATAVQATEHLRSDLEVRSAFTEARLQQAVGTLRQKLGQSEQMAAGEFARAEERVAVLEANRREAEATLEGRLEILKGAVAGTDAKMTGMAARLTSFLSWFNQAGAWARLNGKPEQ